MTFFNVYGIGLAIIIGLMILLWAAQPVPEEFQHRGYLLGSGFCHHGLGVLCSSPRMAIPPVSC